MTQIMLNLSVQYNVPGQLRSSYFGLYSKIPEPKPFGVHFLQRVIYYLLGNILWHVCSEKLPSMQFPKACAGRAPAAEVGRIGGGATDIGDALKPIPQRLPFANTNNPTTY